MLEITPTQRKIADRRRQFRGAIAAKAAALKEAKRKAELPPPKPEILPPATPPRAVPRSPYWFSMLPEETLESYPTIAEIKQVVCRHYGVTHTEIISARRLASITFPRQVAMYLCKHLTPFSYPMIGSKFGGRDHSTAIHAARTIEALIQKDEEFACTIASLKDKINGHTHPSRHAADQAALASAPDPSPALPGESGEAQKHQANGIGVAA